MPVAAPTLSAGPEAALVEACRAGEAEPAIEQAFRTMVTRGGDVGLLLALGRAMAGAGLAGMAAALLKSAGAAVTARGEVAGLLDEIAGLPTGEVPRQLLQERFACNAQALVARRPELAWCLGSAALPRDVRVYRSRAGNLHAVREHATAERFETVFPFIDFRAAASQARLPAADLATAYLLAGVPSPQMLQRLLAVGVDDYRPPVDILETDAQVFAIWLHLCDQPQALHDARIGVFIGPTAVQDYRRFVLDTPGRIPASLVITNHRAPGGPQPPRVDNTLMMEMAREIRRRHSARRAQLDERLAKCDTAFWRQRFAGAVGGGEGGGAQALRIVGFTNRYSTVVQHAMRDLAAAFRRKGHAFEIISQPDDCSAAVDVAGALADNHHRGFDLMVAINHLRFEYADAMPRSVPFVGWIQDHMDHLWTRQAAASIGDGDLVIAHAPHVMASLYGYPPQRMLASSNLTDPHTYSAERLPAGELARHACDLSFVSHGAATPQALVDELGAATTPAFHRLLQQFLRMAHEHLQRNGCASALRLVEIMLQAEAESGHPRLASEARRAHVYPQIAKIHDRLLRHQTLEWAAGWARSHRRSLRIYGRGWDRHPTLGAYACGEAASGRELRAVYQASRICLQANGYASLHQRLLDGLACGACVLSRYNPADFIREPFARIAHTIRARGLASLDELLALRSADGGLAQACEQAERLSGAVIAAGSDARRREQIRQLREGNDITEFRTDDGLFTVLRDMRFMPARVADELPGFRHTVFRSQQELHGLLEGLVDDENARRSLAHPMQQAVLASDTFDVLTERIIRAFAEGSAAQCAGS